MLMTSTLPNFKKIDCQICINNDGISNLTDGCIYYTTFFNARGCCCTTPEQVAQSLKPIHIVFLHLNSFVWFWGEQCFCKTFLQSLEEFVLTHVN